MIMITCLMGDAVALSSARAGAIVNNEFASIAQIATQEFSLTLNREPRNFLGRMMSPQCEAEDYSSEIDYALTTMEER